MTAKRRNTQSTKAAEPTAPEAEIEKPTETKAPEAKESEEPAAPEANVAQANDPDSGGDEEESKDADQESPEAEERMVKVRNRVHLDYVQPSTQIRIHGGEERLLLDDVWLMQQCNAKLLERV